MGASQSLSPDRLKTRIFIKLYNDGGGMPVRDQLMSAFSSYDTDGSKQISKSELEAAAIALGFEPNPAAVASIFEAMDGDQSGEIEFEEFLVYLCGPPPEEGEGEEETPIQYAARKRIQDARLRIDVHYFDIWGDDDPFLGSFGVGQEKLEEISHGSSLNVAGPLVERAVGDSDSDINAFVQGRLNGTVSKATVIDIDVESCSDLPKMDMTSQSDPYVVVKWDDETRFTSEVVQNNANPAFDQAVTQIDHFDVEQTGELTLEVWDKNSMTKDKFIGKVTMPCAEVIELGQKHDRLDRELEGGKKAKKGKIQFALKAREMFVFTLAELNGLLEINGNVENGVTTGDSSIADSPYAIVHWNGKEVGKTRVMEGLPDPCNPEFGPKDKGVFRIPAEVPAAAS
jgi:hypothetical protein